MTDDELIEELMSRCEKDPALGDRCCEAFYEQGVLTSLTLLEDLGDRILDHHDTAYLVGIAARLLFRHYMPDDKRLGDPE